MLKCDNSCKALTYSKSSAHRQRCFKYMCIHIIHIVGNTFCCYKFRHAIRRFSFRLSCTLVFLEHQTKCLWTDHVIYGPSGPQAPPALHLRGWVKELHARARKRGRIATKGSDGRAAHNDNTAHVHCAGVGGSRSLRVRKSVGKARRGG